MGIDQRTANGVMVQRVFETLLKFPDGLPIKDLVGQIDQRSPNGNGNSFYEALMSSCIPSIKAGWLVSRGHNLSVTEEGRIAYDQFKDPLELMKQAAKHSTKGWLSFHFPRSYYAAGKTKDQIVSEVRAMRRIGLKQVITRFVGKPPSWQKVLPVQSLRHDVALDGSIQTWQELVDHLTQNGWGYHEGGHAIYLPPCSFKNVFADLAQNYPPRAGLKIVKEQGSVDQVNYVGTVSKGDSLLHLNSVYGHRHLTLVANLLYSTGLGPRLFDLVEIKCGDVVWTAYVIEDVSGGTPSMVRCEAGINQLRQLEKDGLLRVVTPEGFNDPEFTCPECENNALVTEHGAFKYIDFQNFVLGDYGAYLRKIAVEATKASHFGEQSILRGGRYLYQTVPGVNLPAKRNIEDRIGVLERLLETSGVSIKEKLVLDVGCNIGMMMSEYLRMGALWTHGWDRPNVVPYTEKLLLALGCTRFSTSGADITDSYDLGQDIPEFLAPALEGCVMSYLAVRGHIGWIQSLQTIPWSALIYEGHEGETREDFETYVRDFDAATNNIEVAALDEYIDGDSDRRTIAIFRRK